MATGLTGQEDLDSITDLDQVASTKAGSIKVSDKVVSTKVSAKEVSIKVLVKAVSTKVVSTKVVSTKVDSTKDLDSMVDLSKEEASVVIEDSAPLCVHHAPLPALDPQGPVAVTSSALAMTNVALINASETECVSPPSNLMNVRHLNENCYTIKKHRNFG